MQMTKKTKNTKSNILVDLLSLMTASLALSWLLYHPYYFGDELTAFFREGNARRFYSIYTDLNTYKPRLVFNALWALYGSLDVSRRIPMFVNASCLGGAASLMYLIALRHFGASRILSLLLAATLITSRFGIMLYFDYLSGNIETLSLLFFLAALYYAFNLFDEGSNHPSYPILVIVLSCLCVFVHERYIAATFVMGAFLVVKALHANNMKRRVALCGVATALLPGIAFFLAGKVLGSLPISTGTSGRMVSVGIETASSFLSYLANVFLDTNFGSPWFVGTLKLDTSPGVFLIPTLAISLLCLWLTLLIKVRQNNDDRLRTLLVFSIVIALIVVASLPGPNKQESRWMFPAAAVLGLFAISVSRRKVAYLLLITLLTGNVVYYYTGSYKGIFNVQASTTARQFGEAFQRAKRPDGPGIILNAPEPQTSWWLGGDTVLGNDASSGLYFCRKNFRIDAACIYPPTAMNTHHYTFGFKYGHTTDGGPTFTYTSGHVLDVFNAIREAAISGDHASSLAFITTSPSTIDTCNDPDAKANITVRWSVKDAHHATATVWLVAANSAPALFSSGGAVGSAETGKWVTSRVSFVLTDSKTDEVLAVASVKNKTCANASSHDAP